MLSTRDNMVYAIMAANCSNNSPAFQISDGSSIVPTNPDLWVYDTKELVSSKKKRPLFFFLFGHTLRFTSFTVHKTSNTLPILTERGVNTTASHL